MKWIIKNQEVIWWTSGLLLLFFMNPANNEFSFCPSTLIGLHCPGCGLGHAIHYALRLQFSLSIHHHLMGIPAVIIIFIRIKQLLFKSTPVYATQSH